MFKKVLKRHNHRKNEQLKAVFLKSFFTGILPHLGHFYPVPILNSFGVGVYYVVVRIHNKRNIIKQKHDFD